MEENQNKLKLCMQNFILCKTNIRSSSQNIFVEYWYICYALLADNWKTRTAEVNRWLSKLKLNDIIFWMFIG
jgi:hypothetical protein